MKTTTAFAKRPYTPSERMARADSLADRAWRLEHSPNRCKATIYELLKAVQTEKMSLEQDMNGSISSVRDLNHRSRSPRPQAMTDTRPARRGLIRDAICVVVGGSAFTAAVLAFIFAN